MSNLLYIYCVSFCVELRVKKFSFFNWIFYNRVYYLFFDFECLLVIWVMEGDRLELVEEYVWVVGSCRGVVGLVVLLSIWY